MSPLQKLVNSIVDVLANYYHTQPIKHKNSDYTYEKMINLDYPKLLNTLDTLIAEATQGSSSRGPLLEYFKFVFQKLKPIVDNNAPLNQKEINLVKDILVALIADSNFLMDYPDNAVHNILYNEKTVGMYGLKGRLRSTTAGQAISACFLAPFNLQGMKDPVNIKKEMDKLIEKHQVPLQFKQLQADIANLENHTKELQEIQAELTNSVESLNKRNDDLTEKYELSLTEKEQLTLEKQQLLEENKKLVIEKQQLLEENEKLQHENSERCHTTKNASSRISLPKEYVASGKSGNWSSFYKERKDLPSGFGLSAFHNIQN